MVTILRPWFLPTYTQKKVTFRLPETGRVVWHTAQRIFTATLRTPPSSRFACSCRSGRPSVKIKHFKMYPYWERKTRSTLTASRRRRSCSSLRSSARFAADRSSAWGVVGVPGEGLPCGDALMSSTTRAGMGSITILLLLLLWGRKRGFVKKWCCNSIGFTMLVLNFCSVFIFLSLHYK